MPCDTPKRIAPEMLGGGFIPAPNGDVGLAPMATC
jgi:hypothetical protein